MSNIDDRVVSMRFDNTKFAAAAQSTLSMLDKLKTSISGLGSSKSGLDALQAQASKFSLANIGTGVDGISAKFLALSTVGITALANITNRAVDAGLSMAKSLTIAPISDGFAEYEKGIGSVQTILSNTREAGTTLEEVSAALEELNTYSDKTIYNFGEMTRNIGTFTAAGVDLDTAVSSIKGIANLAAASGSSSEQASTAMYQLSQAISAGRVGLQDWNSVVNAGMGGAVFQKALRETGVAMDTIAESAIRVDKETGKATINGQSFRESIMAQPGQESWLTGDVLTTTLEALSGDLSIAELKMRGFSEESAKALRATALDAYAAATNIKTFSQLMDTTKEQVGSGWATTWKLVFGDFNQAKKSFTRASFALGGLISGSADARNKILGDWQDLGGRKQLIKAVMNVWEAFGSVLGPIRDGFRDVFPPATGKTLLGITAAVREFTRWLVVSKETGEGIRKIFRALFTVMDIGFSVVGGLIRYFVIEPIRLISPILGSIIELVGSIVDIFFQFGDATNAADGITKIFDGLIAARAFILEPIIKVISTIISAFATLIREGPAAFIDVIGDVPGLIANAFSTVVGHVGKTIDAVGNYLDGVLDRMGILGDFIRTIFNNVSDFFGVVGDSIAAFLAPLGKVGAALSGLFQNASAYNFLGVFEAIQSELEPIVDWIGTAVPAAFETMLSVVGPIATAVGELISGAFASAPAAFGAFGQALADLGSALSSIFGGFSTDGVGESVGNLNASLEPAITTLDRLKEAAGAVKEFMGPVLSEIGGAILDIIKAVGTGLKYIAGAIGLAIYGIFKGAEAGGKALGNLPGGLLESLKAGFDNIKNAIFDFIAGLTFQDALALINTGFFIAFYISMKRFFGSFRGLIDQGKETLASIGGTFDQISGSLKTMQTDVRSNIILKIAAAIALLTASIYVLSKIDSNGLKKGLGAVAALLAMLTANLIALEKTTTLSGAANMVVLANALAAMGVALIVMAGAVALFGNMDAGTIKKGLISIGTILAGITAMTIALTKTGGAGSMLVAAAAVGVLAVALTAFAGAIKLYSAIDPKTLLAGGVAIALALRVIQVTMSGMPPNMLAIAAGVFVVANALVIMAGALKLMGGMSVKEIAKSIGVLGASLLILTVAMNAMNGAIVGAKALAIVASSMILLATALKILGSMSLEEILLAVGALAASLTVLGVAAALMSPVAPVLVSLAGAIALMGLAMALAGVGVLAFSAGLAALAVTGTAGIAVLVAAIIAAAGTIPLIAQQIGLGIVAIAKVIAESGPPLIGAFTAILNSLLQAAINVTPKLGELIRVLLAEMLRIIRAYFPDFVETAFQLLLALLRGIRDHMGEVADVAFEVVTKFMDEFAEKLPKLADRGFKALIKLMDGITTAINNNSEELGRAGGDLAVAIVEGLIDGLGAAVDQVAEAAGNLAGNALDAIGDKFGIGGPSKETMHFGKMTGKGLELGIDASGRSVEESAGRLGDRALSGMKRALARMAEQAETNIDSSPVIAPVLDLTEFERKASQMGALMPSSVLAPDANMSVDYSYAQAADISAVQEAAAEAAAIAENGEPRVRDIKIEQNLNSPKALSPADVYRETKSAAARIREEVGVK